MKCRLLGWNAYIIVQSKIWTHIVICKIFHLLFKLWSISDVSSPGKTNKNKTNQCVVIRNCLLLASVVNDLKLKSVWWSNQQIIKIMAKSENFMICSDNSWTDLKCNIFPRGGSMKIICFISIVNKHQQLSSASCAAEKAGSKLEDFPCHHY